MLHKRDLVKAIADDCNVTRKDAQMVLDSTLKVIMETVARGESIRVFGFGTFERRLLKTTTRRDPRSSGTMQCPATAKPRFRAGRQFVRMVRPE